jgi:hypothetical protein
VTRFLAILVGLALLAPCAASGTVKRTMQLGYVAADDEQSFALAKADGARIVRLLLRWSFVAPQPPAAPTDPADPAYRWPAYDALINSIRAAGFRPLVTVVGAPAWAEGPDRAATAPPGTWRPDPAAFGAFVRAAATRYSGRVAGIRKVNLWQMWNEPNLGVSLTPQGPASAPEAPLHYRRMLNAGYRGVKGAQPRAKVITAGTAPYGDETGNRTRPVRFWRTLLCVKGKRLRRTACPGRAHFDIWSHHPYGVGGPTQHAISPDDAAIPDMGRIARVVRAAVKRRTVRPRRAKQAWVTEFSWDSSPPDPEGVPAATHAKWLEGALFQFWRAGVTTALWFRVVDQPPTPSYGASYQSGTHLIDGTPKPAALAYRFPFATGRPGRATVVWGLAPRSGRVLIQKRSGGAWRTVARPRAGAGRVFSVTLRTRRGTGLRAVQRPLKSLTWRVGVDGS